jgi:hypothetical protein
MPCTTWLVTVTVLCEVFVLSVAETVPVFESVPRLLADGTTWTVTVAVPLLFRTPRFPVTVPPDWEMLPWLDVAITNDTPVGSVSENVVFVALFGPAFEIVNV